MKEQIKRRVKYMFALAEVRCKTEKVQNLLEHYSKHHPMYPEQNDSLCPEIMATYNGTETPDAIGISLDMLFPRMLGLPFTVKITNTSSIDQIAEEYYQLERKSALETIRGEIKGWKFSVSEVFPDAAQSSSIH